MQNYLNELNPIQADAVKYLDGPSLIIAGAGSGKTRVLTYKIVHLLNSGYKPSNILALTFTNKAAREMQTRMKMLANEGDINKLWIGTFHSIFAKLLRIEGQVMGFPSTFTIYDADDAKREIKDIIKEKKLDPQQYPANEIYSRISKAKNNLVLPSSYEKNYELQKFDSSIKRPETLAIYKSYYNRCRKAQAMDFDDLLLNTNILLRDYPDILDKYQNLFKYILVDEYQDTNVSQYIIVKRLSALHKKICVVGDDSQSIYSFRGAKIENILNFEKDFKNLKTFKLEQNYRSTKNIVNAANSLIEKNVNRLKKVVFTENEVGDKIYLKQFVDDKKEAYFVGDSIKKYKLNNEFDYSDIAILYRTNSQSRTFEEVLRRKSIPYKIYGSISFYQRAEIKDIVAYLRLIINKRDDQAIKRIINYPKRAIGNTTMQKIINVANSNELNIWDVLLQIEKLSKILSVRVINAIRKFVNLIDYLTEEMQKLDAFELVNLVLEKTTIKQVMSNDTTTEGVNKYQNVEEFTNAVRDFTDNADDDRSITKFLEEIALATDQDKEADDQDNNKVTMMTVHASKGLEFKKVYIVGMEEGLFPSYLSTSNDRELEEERRLMYVAITRCEKILHITSAASRMKWGKYTSAAPSRFLTEINPKYLEMGVVEEKNDDFFENKEEFNNFADRIRATKSYPKPEEKVLKKIKPEPTKNIEQSRQIDKKTGLEVGMKVEHTKFGRGKIIEIIGNFPNTKAIVNFEQAGQKTLLLKFAKLTIIK